MSWRVFWQDYSTWRTRDLSEPRPALMVRDFDSYEGARLFMECQKSLGITCCSLLGPVPRERQRYPRLPLDMPIQHKAEPQP